jgi:hypothetical protein
MSTENTKELGNEMPNNIEDLTLNETKAENVKGGILIGLLLPAVQK